MFWEAMKAAGISDGCLLALEVINHMDKNRPFVDFSDGRNAGTIARSPDVT